jgi:hypothetical protein
MDLVKGELGSCTETGVTSAVDVSGVIGTEAERVCDIKEEEEHEPMTIPKIKMEPNVSCVPVVSVMHVSCMLCPELTAGISICPSDTIISSSF